MEVDPFIANALRPATAAFAETIAPPRMHVWIRQVAVYLQRTFSNFTQMCHILGFPECSEPIKQVQPGVQLVFDQLGLKEPTAEEREKMLSRKAKQP